MKRLLLATCLGMLALGATAQAQAEPDSAARIRSYEIELPVKPFHMFGGDFDIYKGRYALSNGETMVLRSRGRRMFADIGNRPRTEMIAATPNEFVAVDRQFKMTLAAGDFGDVNGEVLLTVPSQAAQANGKGGEVVRLSAGR
jgi:hypothetical protein